MCATKSEQFLARISGRKVSSLSEHNRRTNHVELKGPNKDDPIIRFKGPNKDDPIIRFDIRYASDIKAGTVGFE